MQRSHWSLVILFLLLGACAEKESEDEETVETQIEKSQADIPLDENNPEDVVALRKYLLREQYGDRPLFDDDSEFWDRPSSDSIDYFEKVYVLDSASSEYLERYVLSNFIKIIDRNQVLLPDSSYGTLRKP